MFFCHDAAKVVFFLGNRKFLITSYYTDGIFIVYYLGKNINVAYCDAQFT